MRNLQVWQRGAVVPAALFIFMSLGVLTAQMTTWSGTYTSVSQVTVLGTTHQIGSPYIGVEALSGSPGNYTVLGLSAVSWSIDSGTYTVTVNFNNPFSGKLKLQGPWPSSPTGTSTDFQASIDSTGAILYDCNACSTSAPALRTYNGYNYAAASGSSLDLIGLVSFNVWVYMRGNRPKYGVSFSQDSQIGLGVTASEAQMEYNLTAMPTGANVVPLASAVATNGQWGSLTDLRPAAFH